MNNKHPFITTSHAARILALSPERVRQLAAGGKLASVETPLGRLFARHDVEKLAERRRTGIHPSEGGGR